MKPSVEARLATRLRVLQTWVAHPDWYATRIGKECGGVSESSVRNIIKRYGPEFKAGLEVEAPKDKPRTGRPMCRTPRWQRCNIFDTQSTTHIPCMSTGTW